MVVYFGKVGVAGHFLWVGSGWRWVELSGGAWGMSGGGHSFSITLCITVFQKASNKINVGIYC